MDIKDAVKTALKEFIAPEFDRIKEDSKEIKATLVLTNKRLDDINLHLADQSRRLDETNHRIDAVKEDLTHRLDETNQRIDAVREDLTHRLDETNNRINRLYEVIVRRDEHYRLDQRVADLERDVNDLKRRAA
jgi:chromosome segregation ATPase